MIFWIHASSRLSIETAYSEFARDRAGVDEFVVGKNWFTKLHVPWLVIFDNADDTTFNLAEYFPNSDRGCIMVTSRNPDCRKLATLRSERLGPLMKAEARDLLLT